MDRIILIIFSLAFTTFVFASTEWVACTSGYHNEIFISYFYTGCGYGTTEQAAIDMAKKACGSSHCESKVTSNTECVAAIAGSYDYGAGHANGVGKGTTSSTAINAAYLDGGSKTHSNKAYCCIEHKQEENTAFCGN